MYIQKLTIENIRGLKHFEMTFPENPAGWHVIIGDNGAGKSTLIRAISLGLIGPNEVRAAHPNFAEWLRKGEKKGLVELVLQSDKQHDIATKLGKTGKLTAKVLLQSAHSLSGLRGGTPLVEAIADDHAKVAPDKYLWSSTSKGWFSAGFGPFRRFTGGDTELDKVYLSSPRCGAHLSVFGEDVALTEVLNWLKEIDYQQLKAREKKIRQNANPLNLADDDNLPTGSETEVLAEVKQLWEIATRLRTSSLFSEAESLLKRALALTEKTTGPEHPSVATGLNNLSTLFQETNRLAEAEPLMCRALAINEASFGPEHPSVATSLNNLAQLLKSTNRLAEAEPLMRRALAIDEASFGPEHPDVAVRLNNLAQLLRSTNRLAEAEPLMRRALAVSEASFGPEHSNVATSLNNLALLLQETHGIEEANALVQQHQAKLAALPAKSVAANEVVAPAKLPLDDNAWLAQRLRAFINESKLLPVGTEFKEISANGPLFRDSNGQLVAVTELSDGFRSILSLAFELIRQLVRVYGLAAVFPLNGKSGVIELPGVVLIDEVDTHLHPTWQARIGQWFTKCFPQLQFIVTTHTPLICRAVGDTSGSIWRLPTPGQGEQVEEVTGTERLRLRLGNVLDAYGTGLFGGQEVEQSAEATALLAERARLSAREAVGKASPPELKRLRELRHLFSSVDAAIEL